MFAAARLAAEAAVLAVTRGSHEVTWKNEAPAQAAASSEYYLDVGYASYDWLRSVAWEFTALPHLRERRISG